MAAPTGTKKGKLGSYFRGVRAEMKKVIWPSKKELINYTGVVLVISGLVALTVWILDLLIKGGLSLII
ncbi:MAG: preprotein translocase subunit SecE [Tissierellia bacterium]|nr:preprotein translocase subunit SecE [Tissierellia bacterium]